PFGSQAFNLAAVTAAMIAGPDAHPGRERRWIATVSAGLTYAVLGLGAGLATALVAAAPPVLIEAVAGLALLGALAASLSAALREEELREAAVVTFSVTASSVTIASISAPFWGLLAGLALLAATRRVRRPTRL
ncbi:MAG: benzoate/H(+) symporter BenE family transporter, partial [Gaiellaceae bacterium]